MFDNVFVLIVEDIYMSFGDLEVFKGVLFIVYEGDVIFIFGFLGLGKFIFLCCINFLNVFDKGCVVFEGEEVLVCKDVKGNIIGVDVK